MPDQPRLSVIIVSWNTCNLVLDAISSARADMVQAGIQGDIWVVDNASSDGTVEAVRHAFTDDCEPFVHVLALGENLGFGAGNNYALRQIGFPEGTDLPDYVLLLNPDTQVQPGAMQALIQGLESTGAGLGGARLVHGDGSFQHSAFAFPGLMQLLFDLFPVPPRLYDSRFNGRYSRLQYEAGIPFEVDHPLGATFLLRREVIQQTGMFDEQFHLYCEEVDWAMRIKQAGWRVVCVPQAEVMHYAGQSTSQVRPQSVISLWTARLQLYRKHYTPLKRMLAKIIIRSGMNRLIQQTARDSSQTEDSRRALIDAYVEVISLTRKL